MKKSLFLFRIVLVSCIAAIDVFANEEMIKEAVSKLIVELYELKEQNIKINRLTYEMQEEIEGLKKELAELKSDNKEGTGAKKIDSVVGATAVINVGYANLRISPFPYADIAAVQSRGYEFIITGYSKGEHLWYSLVYKGEEVWVYSKNVYVTGGIND